MTTTLLELRRQVLGKLKRSDGEAMIAVDQAINEAQKVIARVRDFDELIVSDTANAATVTNQKLYHISNAANANGLGLTRPKDIITIRYMANAESRKLTYVAPRELDEKIPYPEIFGTGKPSWYTRRGKWLELIRTPDANANLYILHSQWPATLANDTDETDYTDIDDVIVALSTDIALAVLEEGVVGNWFQRAKELLGVALAEDSTRPDTVYVARPFSAKEAGPPGEYWNDPWVKKQP